MTSSIDVSLKDKLTEDQLEVALYLYIGQNIREEGILKQDSYLEKKAPIIQYLLDQEIAEQSKWYKHEVLRISYRFTVPIRIMLENKLKIDKEKLSSLMEPVPKNLLAFFIYEYLERDLSFPIKKDWTFDWKEMILENDIIKKNKEKFFEALIKLNFCVKTFDYVSTRGGELRDEKYVISAEIREFLKTIVPHFKLPDSTKNLAIIHKKLYDAVEYISEGTIEITIKDEDLALGSSFDAMVKVFDDLINRLKSENIIYEIKTVPGFGTEITIDSNALLRFIQIDVPKNIIKPLLSEKTMVTKAEINKEEADFLRMVQILIDKKYSLYQMAAQFQGKELFKSLPYTERCVIDLTNPLPGEEGLRKFIITLHQILEESSTKEILKFREGEHPSLNEWLEIEIPSEASSFYEDAKSFFRELNRLRNFYSHSVDAKGIFNAGQIFNRYLGKYYPEKDDFEKTEVIFIEQATKALESLEMVLKMAWQKKMGSYLYSQ